MAVTFRAARSEPGGQHELIVEADGGSRGNPGVAAGGSLVIDPVSGEVLAELGVYVGITTNNVAEYSGMIAGVRRAIEIAPDAALHVRLDSKLVVEQMSGRWKIKNAALADLARGGRQIEIDDLAGTLPVGQLLGQHDAGIAGAAAGDQGAERPGEVESAREEVVVDLEDMARRAGDQADRLVARVPRRVGQFFVLGADAIHG